MKTTRSALTAPVWGTPTRAISAYTSRKASTSPLPTPIISEYEDLGPHDGSGKFGFTIGVPVFGPEPLEYETLTVTAPQRAALQGTRSWACVPGTGA